MRVMKAKWTIAHLKNKLVWPEFSRYIRLREADWRGYATCVTCGVVKLWKEMQAGHFVPGRMNSILFDERGCHTQCYQCNIGLKGNPRKYDAFMKQRYGQEVIDELDALALQSRSFDHQELVDMYNSYKDKVKEFQARIA